MPARCGDTKLSTVAIGHDNNFNLIRMIAAFAVLISHSFALAHGTTDAEPLRTTLGMALGNIAVDVFFITSGFLVTASLVTRHSAASFVRARALRIFPALWAMLLLTVFGLGVLATSLSPTVYLSLPDTYHYLAKNAALVTGVTYHLPGVFESNPYQQVVNSSLWTLPYELALYALLAAAWFVLRVPSTARLMVFRILVVGAAVAAGVGLLVNHFYVETASYFLRLLYMFAVGAALYLLRDRITLSRRWFWLLALGLALSTFQKATFFVVYLCTVAYLLLYLAYVPAGRIRHYNRVGDYSYGVYLYAFPVQQAIAAMIPDVAVWLMLVFASAATMTLAALSWHFIEQPALRLKVQPAPLANSPPVA